MPIMRSAASMAQHDLDEIVRIARYIEYLKSDRFQQDHWARYLRMREDNRYHHERFATQRDAIIIEAQAERERRDNGYYAKWAPRFAPLEAQLLGNIEALTPTLAPTGSHWKT